MKRDKTVHARVNDFEKGYIRYIAKKVHMSESDFIRNAVMDKKIVIINDLDDLIKELRYQGNNLNQLTVLARQGRIDLVDMAPFMEVYEKTWQTLNSLLSRVD